MDISYAKRKIKADDGTASECQKLRPWMCQLVDLNWTWNKIWFFITIQMALIIACLQQLAGNVGKKF